MSSPEADSAAADPTPPIPFARWALGVLVPLAAWEVGIAIFVSDDAFFDYLLFGTPLVYAAIYCGRHALAMGLPVIRALTIAAFTPAAAFTVYAFPVMGGSLYPLYWIGARPGPIGFPLAFCAACAAYGLLLALCGLSESKIDFPSAIHVVHNANVVISETHRIVWRFS